MAAGGAGGHGEEAGGRPRQARTNGGGEATLALYGGGEPLFYLILTLFYTFGLRIVF